MMIQQFLKTAKRKELLVVRCSGSQQAGVYLKKEQKVKKETRPRDFFFVVGGQENVLDHRSERDKDNGLKVKCWYNRRGGHKISG